MAKKVLYWDSCIFYEWLCSEDVASEKRLAIEEILSDNESGDSIIVTSVITHLEVLPRKLAGKGASDEADYLSLFDGLHFHDIQIDANILMRAREIRDYYFSPMAENNKMMDLGDCIHLAAATINGVDEFHTRDASRRGSKVPLLNLYEMTSVPKLCGKYDLTILSPEAAQPRLEGL
ncbi:hypothetical protein ASG67_04690 [Sphingomonas sp. Leaf339]|uniref:type II toxin-antitoxin system VapC family toxin n=1 Tax=Sphingomonas sp. Leaf339 TaxID=1736343 RepID=UPI0006FD1CA1|nr:PIN domain-containing protein [Sphingomonas sp. Leaf339]KQU62387.1 hypothetical protein ASG67_04690 [Sphingomonas sp. Leaf339]